MVFDFKAALERMGGDEEILKEIAALFIEDSPEQLRRIRQAIDADDAHALERAAHTLKGSVANFGAENAVQAALTLEIMGRKGQLTHANQRYQELETAIGEVQAALREI